MPQRIDNTIWKPHDFKDLYRHQYTQSFKAVLTHNTREFYALRRGLLGYWSGWHYQSIENMNDTYLPGTVFFGMNKDVETIKRRMYEHMVYSKLSMLAPRETADIIGRV